jgi:hypothetical protein|tara:strand:+ start:310 stop:1422 length:1113 start_codon:yes stop_codon:yes gene_type:complete
MVPLIPKTKYTLKVFQYNNNTIYVEYNNNSKICEILTVDFNKEIFPKFLQWISENIPTDSIIVACLPFECNQDLSQLLLSYIDYGFHNPYIATKSPLGRILNNYHVCLIKYINSDKNISAYNDVIYTLEQFCSEDKFCTAKMKLTQSAVNKLAKLPVSEITKTKNSDNTISQKEVAGNLYIEQINDDTVNIVGVDDDTLFLGSEQGVKIAVGLYNFHSHPEQAYRDNKVKLAWPSEQDYIGYLLAIYEDNTIFHLVVAIEGVWIITLSKYWAPKRSSWNQKDIEKICKFIDAGDTYSVVWEKESDTVKWYLNRVNGIKYQGHPLFKVYFKSWEDATQEFEVYYTKNNCNCFTKKKDVLNYIKINNSQKCN